MKATAFLSAKSYVLFVGLILTAVVILFMWIGSIRMDDFHAYHNSTAQVSVANVASETAYFVAEKRRLVSLFGQEHLALINQFKRDPNNETYYAELATKIADYFPNYFAFTVADAKGVLYYEDFDGFVGEYCLEDIKSFAKSKSYNPKIHPNPEAYHFDVMASIGGKNDPNVLFISFHADILSSLLKASQAIGHTLLLTYPDNKSLIEVTADGARNHWNRDDYHLSESELARILVKQSVNGTVWNVSDLSSIDLFTVYRNRIIEQSLVIFSVFSVIGFFSIVLLNREEKRREKSEQDLIIAKETADIANKAKSSFLASMSHELRTPLNAIIGYAELIEDEVDRTKNGHVKTDVIKIKQSGKHLLSLINEILDLSKIEAEKMELYIEKFMLKLLLEDVVTTVLPLLKKNNNTLEVVGPENIGPIHSDATRIRQILYNLLSNAAKFTDNSVISVHVTRELIGEHSGFKISIKDSGIGMSDEQVKQIFKPFAQADNSITRKYGGTGLDLAITKRFCAMLGGEIVVSSELGKGTTFTVKLRTNLEQSSAEQNEDDNYIIEQQKKVG